MCSGESVDVWSGALAACDDSLKEPACKNLQVTGETAEIADEL